jgi:hypothetical protein
MRSVGYVELVTMMTTKRVGLGQVPAEGYKNRCSSAFEVVTPTLLSASSTGTFNKTLKLLDIYSSIPLVVLVNWASQLTIHKIFTT